MVVTLGGALVITPRSRVLTSQTHITVEEGGVLGCVGCAGSFETLNGMPGCSDSCLAWNASSIGGSILVKTGGKALGVHVTLEAMVGQVVVGERGAVMASDWHALSSLTIVARYSVCFTGTKMQFALLEQIYSDALLVQKYKY
jgi:hypothetical protein